ncbi:MAG: radical SAM protein [Candidatus Omnitrophica bacterium]|nr:radical SAM protein [Candidatus Omnitrophota bacterium]
MAKINYYSINEPAFKKDLRRLFVIPFKELLHRAANRVNKRMQGGLLPFPQNIHIEVTNNCNLCCIMCPVPGQAREKGFMDFKVFEKIVRQCEGQFSLEKMAIMGFGEPFLHPDLVSMSRYAKDRGIRHVFTSTNATVLSEKMSRDIILKSGFDLMSFSIDGVTKKTYESIRINAKFEKVIDDIKTFLKLRSEYKKIKPIINMQILVMKETSNEVDDFVDFWNERLGAQDIIFIRDVDTFGAQAEDHRLKHQLPVTARMPCTQLWRDLVITWDGSVTVCCKDVLCKLHAGNIFENSIGEIWNNKILETMRKTHKAGRWDEIPLCKNCNEWNQ